MGTTEGETNEALSQLERQLAKKFPEARVSLLSDMTVSRLDDVIPTGALSLDIALGVGGLPRGKIVELYGPEGSGKSTLALSVIRQAQLRGGTALYLDAENVLDREYCEALGVDPGRFLLSQPETGEEALEMARTALETNAVDVIVFDSVAAMVPAAELAGNIEDLQVGLHARMMSKGLRMLNATIGSSHTLVIFINQLRMKIGGYGNPETTPGGKALKYYSSVRLDVRSPNGDRIAVKGVPVGQQCTVTVRKNKVGPPLRKAKFTITYGQGVDSNAALVAAALDTGIWSQRGAWIYDASSGEQVANGRAKAIDWLDENDDAIPELISRIYATLET